MKKVYLVKKNPEMPAGRENWIVMSPEEYIRFANTPEGRIRKNSIGQLDGCDMDDVIIYAECGEETAAQWRSEKDRHDYLQEAKKQAGYIEMSLDGMTNADGEEMNGEELVRDESQNVEATVVIRIMKEKLRIAVMSLSEEERDLIQKLYLSDFPMGESEYAEHIGQRRSYVNYKKRMALEKLRAMLGSE